MRKAKALLVTLRPHQWVKNLFVAAPVLFSKNLFISGHLVRAAAAVALFCLLSGAVYIINDVVDVEKDRTHPRKARRPIASGRLPIGYARRAAVAIALGALGGALLLGPAFAAAALAYFLLNLAYSMRVKQVAFLDVLSIATGFLLRVVAGAQAIGVPTSSWLLLCTALLACFLGFGKRAHELIAGGERAEAQRAVLARYRIGHLKIALHILAVLTVFSYVMYTLSAHTVAFFHTHRMVLTAPFILVGIVRFLYIVEKRPSAESPTEEMLRDPLFLSNVALWVVAVTVIIYSV